MSASILKPYQMRDHLQAWIRSISQRRTTTIDAHGDTTNQIAHSHSQAGPEQCIASILISCRVYLISLDQVQFCGEYNRHDHAVDRHDFTEDNRDQVLRPYSRCFDTATKDRGASDENSPSYLSSDITFRSKFIALIPCCPHD